MEMPDAVKWLLPIVVGESWPEGDETKLRALRDAWHTASSAIGPVAETGNQAASGVRDNWTGDGADAFAEQWKKFVEGDEAYFKQLADAAKALGDSCDQTALDVEYTKYMIIISLIVLAAQIAAMIAAAAVTFGGSTAGIAPAQIATRMTVQMLFRQLLEKLAQQGFKQVAKELLEKLLKQGLKKIGMEVLKNEAINLGMDAGIQGLQMAKGDRKDWDWSKTSDAAISGAVGGVVGAASGSIGRGATEGLSHSAGGQIADAAMRAGARGAVEGVAQTVGQAAVTGDLGSLTPEQLLLGASSGGVGGAVGGAKEQMHSVHEANIPRADSDGSGDSGDSGGASRPGAEESSSASEPGSRGEPSSEPESRSGSSSEPESRGEEPRREASAEPESRGEEPRREAASAPESRGEEPRREAFSAPESRSEEPRHEASSAPETHVEQPRREALAEPESRSEEPRREAASVPESRGEAASGAEPRHEASPPAEEPDVRREAEPQQRADNGPQPVSEHRAPEASRPSADPVQQPTAASSQPSTAGASSQGGYGMAPPGIGPEPGRQSGGRPQDNVGAAGFTGGPSQPFAAEGGTAPFQNGPSPQQAPPPGGFTPPPGGGLPNTGGPGRAGGPGQRPATPQVGGDQPRRVPPQDPRRMLQGGQPPMPQGGYRPGGQRPHSPQPGGQPLHGGQPGGQPPHGSQAAHFGPQPMHGAPLAGQPTHNGQADHPGGQLPHGTQPGQPAGRPAHNGQPTQPGGQPPHGTQPGQPGGQPPHRGQPLQGGGQPPLGGQGVPPGTRPPHGSQPGLPGAQPPHGGQPPGVWASHGGGGANGQPPQGGVPSQDPRRMPPQGGQRPPMCGQRPAGYPNQPRGPQGPGQHPGGRPPMPPPPGGRPPVPPHDPRLGPPTQVPPPRFGAPQEHLPPRGPFEPPRPVDRALEQPRTQRPFEQPAQDRPIPAAEPTQQPVHERPVEQPSTERPDQRTPGQDHASEQLAGHERPAEHTPAQERPTEGTPGDEHPTDRSPSPEAPADPHPTEHEPLAGEQSPPEHDYGRPGHDEPYLTDPRFHTDDPAGIRRIEDTFMDSGHHSPVDGEWRHEQVRREALARRDQWHPGMSDGGAVAVHAYTRYEMVGPLNHALRMGGPELPHLAPQAAALVSGLNELPPHEGVVSRRVDFKGDPSRLQAFLARFHDGAHITEPSFLSSSKVDAQHPRSNFPGEVEMRIQSKTGRDVEALASIGHEREVLFKAGTQFKITGIEEGPGHPNANPRRPGEPHYVVHAEEIAPGEPGHLGEADARDAIEQRRADERADADRFQREADEELEQFYAEHPEYKPSGGLAGLLNAFDDPDAPPAPERRPPATGEPEGGWSRLAEPLAPGGPPVLHAGSVETPQQHARLVRDAVPELGAVNTRNHYSPDGLENGYRTNAAESMAAFERRMNGEDVVAGPARQQSLGEQLGGPWSSRDSFDDVARELGERPVGARTAVAFETPGGESRLVAAVHTEHGILFADPVTGRLAELPHDATAIHTMPLGGGDAPPHHVVETETINDRLNPTTERLPHDEGYLFDGEHRGTPADHESIRRAVGDEDIYQQIHDRALARRDAAGLPVSDEGAVALHGYTRGEYAYDVNEALRRGPGHPGFDLAQQNTRAIVDGLNQVARESGETIRAYDVGGDPRLAELVAGPYEPGSVVVEPAFSSASIKTGEFSTSKFGDDVELHVRSDNLRDISKLAENPGERESLSPPGTQLLVHEKRLELTPEGRRKWVIVAEEIGPGHPRHLEPEAAQQKMAERRAENEHNAAEFERRKQAALMERLGGLGEPEYVTTHQPSVHDLPETPAEAPAAPVSVHDYSRLARATNPPAEPAIHAGGTTPSERAAYVHDRHPHLRDVNPGFREPGAFENGYVTNCTRGPEAYLDRVRGGDMTAEPILPHEMGSRGTLEHLEGRFGETFSARDSYDDVIREMREKPLDHHAVVAVKYPGPNGVEYGHVAMVVHTREGVAFIDPQSGDLMHLPQPPKSIKLMHVGTPDEVHIGTEHGTGEHGGYGTAAPHDAFLARDDVAAALDGHADAGYIRAHLAEHPGLVRVLSDPANDYLTRSLLDNPKTLASLLKHPEAIPILEDAVHEVNERGYSVIDDVEHQGVEPFDPTPEQAEISDAVAAIVDETEGALRLHASFDLSQAGDPEYCRQWVAEERERWPETQGTLNRITERIAGETDGHPGFRPEPKDDVRALAKIAKYGWDGSRLTDLVGAKIQFERVADMYRALDAVRGDPELTIVKFSDRLAEPQDSGYRDLQLNVRLPNGHVAELRLHLTHIDDVASYEHALYEVRRDFETFSKKEGREGFLSPEEAALDAALTEQVRGRFEEAFRRGLTAEESS
ncbi:toxin glutamine deamidase domain-containing protein [Amycolatopsis mediterranei]|uniref:WXG100-like domain-containing protein n=2 Tax=Amycolatopsis mediterranei TaxID=33910 RepID=UPI0002DFA0B5